MVQTIDPTLEIAVQLANHFVNILQVTPVVNDNVFTHYVILFEYKFKNPRRDGWHKYAIETSSASLTKGMLEVYETATSLQQALSE